METLAEKAQRLGMKPAGKPVATSTAPVGETLTQKAQRLGMRPAPKEFLFDVPANPQDRQNKLAQYQTEAKQAETESKQANSLWGMTKNFGKAFGSTIANSEVGLGQSLAKIIGAGDTTLTDAQKQSSDTEVALLKRINENKAKGVDTTRLQQAYNQLKGSQGEMNDLVKEQFNLPSTSKVVGQIGGTVLDLLTAGTYGKAAQGMKFGQLAPKVSPFVQKTAVATGLSELAPITRQQASGLLTKKGLGNIATGAGIGYASDVTQGLQGARGEDRTGGKAFIPGMGTALGTALPVISEGTQSVKNQFTESGRNTGVATKRRAALDDIEKRYVNVGKAFDVGDRKGVDVRGILSETNLLNGAVDEDGLVSAERALSNFDELVNPYEGKVRDAIQKEGAKVRIADIANGMDDFVTKSNLQGGAQTKLSNELFSDLKGLQSRYGDNIPVEALHDIKIFRGSAANYTDTGANVINKDATRFFKEMVENNTRSLDVKGYNSELSKLYTVRDAIEALNRKRVKGGRMGKYFSSVIGTGIGASSGNPLLAILGAEIGAKTQGAILGRSLGGNISKGMEVPSGLTNILGKTVKQQDVIPPVVIPKTKQPGTLNLQSSNKAGSLKSNQTKTTIPITNAISPTIPSKTTKSSKGVGTEAFFNPAQKPKLLDSIKNTLKDQGGYVATPGRKESLRQVLKRQSGSSSNISRINDKGVERVVEYIDWANGVKKFSGEELKALKSDAQDIAGMIGVDQYGTDKALASEFVKKLGGKVDKKVVGQETPTKPLFKLPPEARR